MPAEDRPNTLDSRVNHPPSAVLFAYSEMGTVALEVLIDLGFEVRAIFTHRDDPNEERWFRTPAERAKQLALGCPVLTDEQLDRNALCMRLRELAPDLILSAFYRRLIPTEALAHARVAALNLHPSLLPRYRGRAPINWVLINREPETGVTLHHMVARPDAGDIVAQRRIAIAPRETALSLSRKVVAEGKTLLEQTLPRVLNQTAPRIPQDERLATVFGRRRPEDGWIDWRRPSAEIDALVRAVSPPWPGAFAELDLGDHEPVRVRITAGQALATPPPALASNAAPGTVHTEGATLFVKTADGCFVIERWQPLAKHDSASQAANALNGETSSAR